ncbi:T9SS type A sorting domain-containing protein [Polaribacter sp. Z014]|uniref:T9SS type A sorting domain-containing protein n=1 Tax=Polaribacter sp. Z014 TaxID=2927126 RepID=UPI0020209389|nr:T9SS type A sorting domain-containing protein [Polaribacter sp. Z014]MCL7763606.1 T9SS type A sorting domain-containing protein [Polaribacter sp. Z014]
MKKILFTLLTFTSLLSYNQLISQEGENRVLKSYFKNKVVSIERWYGNDKAIDSIKTYHRSGNKNETFFFKNKRMHGECYKYNDLGEKVVSYIFDNGKLTKRIDYKTQINKKNAPYIQEKKQILQDLYSKTNYNVKSIQDIYQQGILRHLIGEHFLARENFKKVERYFKYTEKQKKPVPDKIKAGLYNRLGGINAYYQKENLAIHYRNLAIEKDPKNNIYKYNMGSYLFGIKEYRLAINYLEEVKSEWKKHAFSNRALAAIYTEFEEYEKAFELVNLAFDREEALYKFGFAGSENDLRTIRGFLYHKLGETALGINDLNEALELNPNNSFAYKYLGIIQYDLENFEKSCTYLTKSAALNYVKKHDRNDIEYYLESACSKKDATPIITLKAKPYAYPNPTRDLVYIKNLSKKNYQFRIYNFKSILVKKGISENSTFDFSNLQNGLYILTIPGNSPLDTYTFKIIKQ